MIIAQKIHVLSLITIKMFSPCYYSHSIIPWKTTTNETGKQKQNKSDSFTDKKIIYIYLNIPCLIYFTFFIKFIIKYLI
jgi:hypothetical protein